MFNKNTCSATANPTVCLFFERRRKFAKKRSLNLFLNGRAQDQGQTILISFFDITHHKNHKAELKTSNSTQYGCERLVSTSSCNRIRYLAH